MLQLDNQTPFKASIAVLPDRQGIDTVYVIVKATVNLLPKLALAPEQSPPCLADEYYEDPANSSLKQASELHLGKPGTDVLLTGCARAAGGGNTEGLVVRLSVAEREKQVLVMGDRVWQRDGTPSQPLAFQAMPLVWERAFGGDADERNPVGVGLRGKRRAEELVGTPVPNLEDPGQLLQRLGDVAPPACFAPLSPSWLPRRTFAGTYDAAWQKHRAPYLPDDFDPRFFQCAPAELCFERHLQGGEDVHIEGASELGPIDFTIPTVRPIVAIDVDGHGEEPWANLETLLLEPDENRVSLTWRASLACDRKVLKVRKIEVRLRRSGSTR
jgi:hypothetical protein